MDAIISRQIEQNVKSYIKRNWGRFFFARFLVIGPEDEDFWGADMKVIDGDLLNQVPSGG